MPTMTLRTPTRRLVPALVAAVALAATAACSDSSAGSGDSPPGTLRVVTTVAPLTSIVGAVASGHATVDGLVPEGVNSHTFEPPPSAAATLARCDLVFVNGLRLEESTTELAKANKPDDCTLVELGDRVLPQDEWIFDFSFPKRDGKPNPHLWTDPLLALKYAEVVRDELSRKDPAHQADYARNFAALERKVRELDQAMRTATKTVPDRQRALLTYHDGYAYFARDYGWRVVGAVQPANFEDPTPREVTRLIDQIRALKLPAIFGSEVFPSRVLETIGKETGARYVDTLRDDDLPGKPGDPEHSWLGLMRYNFVTMVEALGGDASAVKAVALTGLPEDTARYPQ